MKEQITDRYYIQYRDNADKPYEVWFHVNDWDHREESDKLFERQNTHTSRLDAIHACLNFETNLIVAEQMIENKVWFNHADNILSMSRAVDPSRVEAALEDFVGQVDLDEMEDDDDGPVH